MGEKLEIPRDASFDATLALLRHGYEFVSRRADSLGADIFRTRLLLSPVICMRGAEAAALFYAPGRFLRDGAAPPTTVRLLQGRGSVQLLEGDAHHRRKAMFMSILSAENSERLVDVFEAEWRARLADWETAGRITLLEEARRVLCKSVCAWAGAPLPAEDIGRRSRQFAAMIEGAGVNVLAMLRGLVERARVERWVRRLILAERERPAADPASALHAIAHHRDASGAMLPLPVATLEVINILRPVVAIDRFIMFAAHALHQNPHERARLRDDPGRSLAFVNEVRRFYPFFPVSAGLSREAFEWRGYSFRPRDWVMLDLYGTNHDPRLWARPHAFDADRFQSEPPPNALIPQGGGDHATGHRCAGEGVTVAIMRRAVELLTRAMEYDAPPQDFTVPLNEIPSRVRSGFVMERIRRL
ncbi:MAG: cytochrome P450 [Hyphomicrobiales bacterium]|nr:cytochrome P450 [Hyphomicrobiales bacterium]